MVSPLTPPPAVSSSNIARPDSGPSLLGLPREVRLQIYNVLLHMPDFLRQDWRVTPCLPYVCRQIYEETIPLLYNNTLFSFNSTIMCNIFLDGIGHNITYVRGIKIWFSPLELEGVEKVFGRFPSTSQLHTVALFEREMRSTQGITKKLKDAGPVQPSLAQLNGVRCIRYNAGLYSKYEDRPEMLLAILGICTKMADVNLSSESFFKQPGIIDSFEERYFDPNWRASSQESSRWVLGCTRGFKDHEKTGNFSLQFRNGRAVIAS